MARIYRIYSFISLIIFLFPLLNYSQVIDGGRGRLCLTLQEGIAGTFGTSLEFPKLSPDYALGSLFGEFGMNYSTVDSTNLDKREFFVLTGLQLWVFPSPKFYNEIRISFNAVDLIKQEQTIGWILEAGILIPLSGRFWVTFDYGIGTAFSINRNSHTQFSIGFIYK